MNKDINLMLGDCLELMHNIPDKSVDMILCDLPYGTTACKWDVIIPFDKLWAHYERVIKDNGAIVLFGSEPFSSYLRMSNMKMYKYDWIWEKNQAANIVSGAYAPMKYHEIISCFYKNKPVFNKQLVERSESGKARVKAAVENGTTWKNSFKELNSIQQNTEYNSTRYDIDKKNPGSIISFKRDNYGSNNFHTTQKPVALLEYLIKTYTNDGDLVLDNTMGSGSTGVAAMNLNRVFIGIEKEPKYYEIAEKRINEAALAKIKLKDIAL